MEFYRNGFKIIIWQDFLFKFIRSLFYSLPFSVTISRIDSLLLFSGISKVKGSNALSISKTFPFWDNFANAVKVKITFSSIKINKLVYIEKYHNQNEMNKQNFSFIYIFYYKLLILNL